MNASEQSRTAFEGGSRPWASDPNPSQVVNMNYHTANLLHRTTNAESAASEAQPRYGQADRLDYLELERIARGMRSDYVASLFSSWARTLRGLVSGRDRGSDRGRKAAVAQ